MKVKVYMRVAKTSRGYRAAVATRPSHAPMTDYSGDALPTVAFGLLLNIPDEAS